MAAGTAGDALMGDADTIPNLRAAMERMTDSIAALSNQMAELREDSGRFFRRNPDALTTPIEGHDEKAPAVRERIYARTLESDRAKMREMSEVINENTKTHQ